METAHLTKDLNGKSLEPQERPGYQKLSLLYGILIGTSLALGSWGLEAWRIAGLPLENAYTSLLLGSLALIALCGLAGWLTGRVGNSWVTAIVWLVTSIFCALIIGHQPYFGRTVAEWLADTRSWGLPIYTAQSITNAGVILGSLPIIVILLILAMLQSSRLEQAVIELGDQGRLTLRSVFILLIPMPFVFLAAFLTGSIQIKPAAGAVNVVDRAIQVANSTEEDLGQLGIQTGMNYGALGGVQDQLSDSYTLRIGEIDPTSRQTFILAEFDNGAWINCRTINDQLSFCFDADPPYTVGLLSLISNEPPPESCRGCQIRADEGLVSWLQTRASLLGPDPQIERLGQWGGYVLVEASATDGSYQIECLFDKMSPLHLAACEEKQTSAP
jgi:hypothetical protein